MNFSLDKYICDLLFYHDKIIIPGLGAFTTKYYNTSIHPTQNTFTAPQKVITFDIADNTDDGILISYISKMDKKSVEEGTKFICANVESLNAALQKKESIEFKNIGRITFDIEKKIKFEQDRSFNCSRDSFGFETIQFNPLKRLNLKEKVETTIQKNKIRAKKIKKIKIISISVGGSIALISLLLFIIIRFELFAGISLPTFKFFSSSNQKKLSKPTENKSVQRDKNFTLELFKAKQKKYLESVEKQKNPLSKVKPTDSAIKKENAIPKADVVAAQNLSIGSPTGHYHIVAGTFNVMENANKFVDELKQKGFANARIINPQQKAGLKVIYGSYTTQEEANNELSKIKTNHNKSAWLLIQ